MMTVLVLIVAYFLGLSLAVNIKKMTPGQFILGDIKLFHYGVYHEHGRCGRGQYVVAMRLKYFREDIGKLENGQITALEFKCSDRIGSKSSFVNLIGKNLGEWGEYMECRLGFAIGFAIRITRTRPDPDSSTEKSVKNATLYCDTPKEISSTRSVFRRLLVAVSNPLSTTQFCVPGDALVQLVTKADSVLEFHKNETIYLTHMQATCTTVETPAKFCNFTFKWDQITRGICGQPYLQANTSIENPISYGVNCTFDATLGVEYNSDIDNLHDILDSYGLDKDKISIGDRLILLSKPTFEELHPKARTSFPELGSAISEFIKKQHWLNDPRLSINTTQNFSMNSIPSMYGNITADGGKIRFNKVYGDLGHEQVMLQLVGVCGIHRARFKSFRTRHQTYIKTVIGKMPTKFVFLK